MYLSCEDSQNFIVQYHLQPLVPKISWSKINFFKKGLCCSSTNVSDMFVLQPVFSQEANKDANNKVSMREPSKYFIEN